MDSSIRLGGKACSLIGPFCKLEAAAGKDIAKTGIFPFQRIAETVKIEMPYSQAGGFVRFNHGIGRAFDAS